MIIQYIGKFKEKNNIIRDVDEMSEMLSLSALFGVKNLEWYYFHWIEKFVLLQCSRPERRQIQHIHRLCLKNALQRFLSMI